MTPHTEICRCWKCWTQDNFTSLSLYFLVILSLGLLVLLMHEDRISDEYVKMMEGFLAGIVSAWALSMKTQDSKPSAHPPQTPTDPPPIDKV